MGHCLESHDLAASKLAAYREKDRDFVRILLVEGLIDGQVLLERVGTLPIDENHRSRLERWVSVTGEEL